MYRASTGFHEAVFSKSRKMRWMLKFGDTILTNDDIQIASGITITEAVNPSKELTIGSCPEATLEATLMNFHGLLSDFEFGECEACLSARTETGRGTHGRGTAHTIMRFGTGLDVHFEAFDKEPFLRVDGEPSTAQPPMPIYSILTVGSTIHCIGEDGEVWTAAWVDGRTWDYLSSQVWDSFSDTMWDDIQGILIPASELKEWDDLSSLTWDEVEGHTWNAFIDLPDLNPFMRHKAAQWAKGRRGMSFDDNELYEFMPDGTYEKYEYVKLGTFMVSAPEKRRQNLISIDSKDKMSLFDVDATTLMDSITYPITIGDYFQKLCSFVGVQSATLSFINSNHVLTKAPITAAGITAREILSWIAGAACSFGRMTRDGEVELAWFAERDIFINMDRWFDSGTSISEYTVAPIDKLRVRGSQTDIGVIIGSGTNAYQIIDNPFLYGATDSEIRTLAAPIYSRLIAYPGFSPIIARTMCDWSIQAGDVISFEFKGEIYRLPIYSQTITWRGNIRASYVSTGGPRRPELSAENRQVFQRNRSIHDLRVDVEGISSRLENAEGDVAELRLTVDQFGVEFVSKDGIKAAINLSPETAKILAANISLEGIVTVNSRFRILADGSMEATNGKFNGIVTCNEGSIGPFSIGPNGLTGPGLSVIGTGRINFGNYGSIEGTPNFFAFRSPTGQFDFSGVVRGQHFQATGNVVAEGLYADNLQISGSKNSAVDTPTYGKRLLNAYETAEYFFADSGEDTIAGGECVVSFDPVFSETVNTHLPYHVKLTPYGNGRVWVAERTPTHFVVRGDNVRFGWEVAAKRKGYENHRLEQAKNPMFV